MRKTMLDGSGKAPGAPHAQGAGWLDLNTVASVELSSEDPLYPIEQALTESTPVAGQDSYNCRWQSAGPGPQTVVLRFDAAIAVKRVMLHFREQQHERSQEFSLHAEVMGGQQREVVRQQWNFSPGGSSEQLENYVVNLEQVAALTLWIDPDRGQNRYPATLHAFRVES